VHVATTDLYSYFSFHPKRGQEGIEQKKKGSKEINLLYRQLIGWTILLPRQIVSRFPTKTKNPYISSNLLHFQ
jgi:hypothetical protein